MPPHNINNGIFMLPFETSIAKALCAERSLQKRKREKGKKRKSTCNLDVCKHRNIIFFILSIYVYAAILFFMGIEIEIENEERKEERERGKNKIPRFHTPLSQIE